MELAVTSDFTRRSVIVKIKGGPSFNPHDQNRHRRKQVMGRAETITIAVEAKTTNGVPENGRTVDIVKLLGPQLKMDGSESDTLRVSATWGSYTGHKIEDIPGWLWRIVRDALTGSTEWTAKNPE